MVFASASLLLAAVTLQLDQPKLDAVLLREDLRIAREALEEGHPGIYRYTPQPKMDAWFEGVARRLDHQESALEFYRALAPVVSQIKCGHTAVALPLELRNRIDQSELLIPIETRVLGEKLYGFRAFSDAAKPLMGSEIVAINGVKAADLLRKMLAATPGDADIETGKRLTLAKSVLFNVYLRTVLGLKGPYKVSYRNIEGSTQTVELEGQLLPKIRQAMAQPPLVPAQLKYKLGNQVAVMTIRSFGGAADLEGKKSLSDFYNESFAEIEKRGSMTLIIDLRGNGGGEDEAGKQLLAHLVDKPFQYYDELLLNKLKFDFAKYAQPPMGSMPESEVTKLPDGKYRMTSHPNWGIQQPSPPIFRGRVIVLQDGESFSTTCEFTSNLHKYTGRATFVGEESGGGYYGNNSGPSVLLVLPNSKVRVRIPLMKYVMAVSGPNKRHGVLPDVPVKRTIEDLIEGRDRDMEAALELTLKEGFRKG